MNETDNIPEHGAPCGIIRKGPFRKNLLIPKELASMLRQNVIMGSAWVKSLKTVAGVPYSSVGKKPFKVMMIA